MINDDPFLQETRTTAYNNKHMMEVFQAAGAGSKPKTKIILGFAMKMTQGH